MFASRQIVVRVYKNARRFQRDANRWAARGYDIASVNGVTPKVAIGETLLKSAMTLGFGLVIGGRAHKTGRTTVTYRKIAPPLPGGLAYTTTYPERPQGWEPPTGAQHSGRQAAERMMLALIVVIVVVAAVYALHG